MTFSTTYSKEADNNNEVIIGGKGHHGGVRNPHRGARGFPIMTLKAQIMEKQKVKMVIMTKYLVNDLAVLMTQEDIDVAIVLGSPWASRTSGPNVFSKV